MQRIKKTKGFLIIFIILSVFSFILSSCNISEKVGLSDENAEGVCEYKVNYYLDKGRYDDVIKMLQPGGECADKLSTKEKDLNLAAAYLGKGGFTAISIIRDILSANSTTGDTYSAFLSSIADRASGDALKALDKAKFYYNKVLNATIGTINCNSTNIDDPIVKEACFMKGVVQVATAGTSFALLFKGNGTTSVSKLIDYWVSNTTATTCDPNDINQNGNPDTADFSACAMDYATNNKLTTKLCASASVIAPSTGATCSFGIPNEKFYVLKLVITPSSNCTSFNNATDYQVVQITPSGNLTVVTDGYCKCDGTPCTELNATAGCYPCPVTLSNDAPATQVGTVVEALNEGADSIASVVGGNETEIQNKVNDFIKNFCDSNPSQCACYDSLGNCYSCNSTNSAGQKWLDIASDIKIGLCPSTPGAPPVVTASTQQLLIDYLLSK